MLPVADCLGNLIGSQRTNLHLTSVRGVVISGNDIHSGHQAGTGLRHEVPAGGRKRGGPVILDQRLTVPRDLNELKVSAHLWAHAQNPGGHVEPGIASRDRAIRWKKATDNHLEPSGGVFHEWLTVNVPSEALKSRRDSDVHAFLRSNSGVESGSKANALRIRAR